jgi:DNA polymerase delta subunit 3
MSISAQQQKDGNRKLKQWLENDKKVVTYRDISREIACHVNHAKKYVLLIRLAYPQSPPILSLEP